MVETKTGLGVLGDKRHLEADLFIFSTWEKEVELRGGWETRVDATPRVGA